MNIATSIINLSVNNSIFQNNIKAVTYGEILTFSCAIQGSNDAGEILQGSIDFYCGANIITSAPIIGNEAAASFQLTAETPDALPAGHNLISASYSGNGTFAPSQSDYVGLDVAHMPVKLDVSPDVINFMAGGEQCTLISAQLSLDDSKIASGLVFFLNVIEGGVRFKLDGKESCTAYCRGGYQVHAVIRGIKGGAHLLSASYSGGHNFLPAEGAAVEITIPDKSVLNSPKKMISLALGSHVVQNAGAKDKLILTATANIPGTGLIPNTSITPGGAGNKVSGNVEFIIDGTNFGSSPLDDVNTARLIIDTLSVGQHWAVCALTDGSGISEVVTFSIAPAFIPPSNSPTPQGTPVGGSPGMPFIPGMGGGFPGMGGGV